MARSKSIKTRYPGVFRLEGEPGKYRIRGDVTNKKTGKKKSLDAVVEAKNERHAAQRRTEELEKLESEMPQSEERPRLKAYAQSWMRSKLPSFKASTRAHTASILDNCILPELGDHYCHAIESDDIAKWRDGQAHQMVMRGGKLQPIKPDTVNGRLAILKRILRDAVDDLNLPRDPTRRVADLRTLTVDEDGELTEGDGKSITAEQLAVLLSFIQKLSPEWYPFFFVLAFTGMRFGEASALKWADRDKQGGKLWVRRAQWKGKVDTLKTAGKKKGKGRSAVRSLPLVPELDAVLEQHHTAQRDALVKRLKRDLQRAGVARLDEEYRKATEAGWMFPAYRRKGGQLMHNTAPAKPLKKALEAAEIELKKKGLEPIGAFTVHGLRHTFNNIVRQLAEAEGQNIVGRAMTGHSGEDMQEHYSHVSVGEKAAVVGRMLRLVKGTG
jgi:integrase